MTGGFPTEDPLTLLSSVPPRRVASVAQSAPSEAPSCSPFGKKKKYKDKYLAKHSASYLPGPLTPGSSQH
jgi:hypothetical protein